MSFLALDDTQTGNVPRSPFFDCLGGVKVGGFGGTDGKVPLPTKSQKGTGTTRRVLLSRRVRGAIRGCVSSKKVGEVVEGAMIIIGKRDTPIPL